MNFLRLTGVLVASALPAFAQQIPVIERHLSNGFKLLLVERHEEPRIAGGWVVKVGSSNERLGTTGIAHLFEHMMFKGTPTLGTKDAARDLQLIAEQERVRGEMRKEEALMRLSLRRGQLDDVTKPENFTPRYKELEVEFKKLIDEQRQLLVKNEFDRVYTTAGASGMNAFTSEDMTGYFITVPANKLELWCWMESERLLRPVFREFYAERDVVYEERRMRVESTPIGKFGEQFTAMFWDAHPYMWPVLGWPSDIPNITKRDADEFYALFYQPQNITLILVGDFKADAAEAMVRRYFERIPAGTQPPPEVITREPDQVAEKRMYAEAETNPQVDILWKTVGFQHQDSYPLDILQLLLSNRTGRLYKGLVLGSEVATDTYAVQDSKKWAGYFNIGGEAKDGKTPQDVEQGIYAELDKLKEELVPADELQKVKNQFAAFEYRKLTANFPIFIQVLQNEGLGDWREVNEANAKLQAVTAEDVQRVARKYFTREARAVAIYNRKPGSGSASEDPDLVGLSADQKPVVRRIIESLLAEKDVAKLKQALAQMQAQTGTPDPKRQQLQNIIQKKVAARIAELEKQ
ncbi:MAG: insulinase family protein [Verrucomicrobia bacterium]|nr:insulinase family protein [Verrucomicrobiota bacterium]